MPTKLLSCNIKRLTSPLGLCVSIPYHSETGASEHHFNDSFHNLPWQAEKNLAKHFSRLTIKVPSLHLLVKQHPPSPLLTLTSGILKMEKDPFVPPVMLVHVPCILPMYTDVVSHEKDGFQFAPNNSGPTRGHVILPNQIRQNQCVRQLKWPDQHTKGCFACTFNSRQDMLKSARRAERLGDETQQGR